MKIEAKNDTFLKCALGLTDERKRAERRPRNILHTHVTFYLYLVFRFFLSYAGASYTV